MISVELTGVDGRNLLAFLAAVGMHVALDRKAALIARLLGRAWEPGTVMHGPKDESVRMAWHPETFRPTIHLPSPVTVECNSMIEDVVIRVLRHALIELAGVDQILPWKNIKGLSREDLRDGAFTPAACRARSKANRLWADFVAGLASDAIATGSEKEYTALCVITGDSRQDFLGCMRELRKQVTADHLKDALFAQWKYKEQGKTFRWDPSEDRRYALRASDPAKGRDKEIPSMWGANRLAFEALTCFPCFPQKRHLCTTGFEDERILRWPLWTSPIDLMTLRSLLAHPAVVQKDARVLGAMGVFALASSRRMSLGRKRTFGPTSLWPIPT